MSLTYRGIKYKPQIIEEITANTNTLITGKYRGVSCPITISRHLCLQSLTTLRYRGVDYFPEINYRIDLTKSRTKVHLVTT